MKDLIAKLKSDATCAMGALWIHMDSREAHIDAQAARIAELEAQIADWAGLVGGKDGEIYSLRQQLAVASAHQADNTDKLRQAILAILPNPPASLDKHESASYCVDFRAGLKAAAELVASTALQAPVREVPEGWAFSTADFSVQASGSSKYGYVTLKRDAKGSAAWHALDDMQKDATELYLYGKGETVAEAIADAVSKIDAAPLTAAPVQQEGE